MKNFKEIIQITLVELFNYLLSIQGHPFTAIELWTEPVLTGGKKTLALFNGAVYKHSKYVFCANRDYNRALEILAEKLGIDFTNWKPQDHNYADNVGGNVLTHRADLSMPIESQERRNYAQFILHKDCQIEVTYFDGELNEIPYENIKPYLREQTSKKQSEQLGLSQENQIKIINPSLKSIKRLSAFGKIYEIVD